MTPAAEAGGLFALAGCVRFDSEMTVATL